MENQASDEKGSIELDLWMKKLSLSSDHDQPRDTTLSDLAKAVRGSDRKRDQSSYLEDEVSTAADDIGGRPGSIYKVRTTLNLRRIHELISSCYRVTAFTSRRQDDVATSMSHSSSCESHLA